MARSKVQDFATVAWCILLAVIFVILCPEPSQNALVFENSTDLCNRCNCTEKASVLYLNCTARGMHHTIANWPSMVTNEKVTKIVAHFNHNSMKSLEPLPQTNAELIVYFARNEIQELYNEVFLNCGNVTFVDLSYNKITSENLISDVFCGAYNDKQFEPIGLRTLILAHNNLHTLNKNLFEHLVHLKWLDLSGNRFRIIDELTSVSFKALGNLEYLNLSGNRMIHLNTTSFENLKSLRYLDLSNNELDFIPDAVKDVAKTLTILRIDNNPIIEINEDNLLGLESLVEFSAKNLSLIEEIKTNAFGTLKNLRKVDLSFINHNVLLADYVFSSSIREMNLSHSNLEILSAELLNWTQLEVLDLRGNQLFCTCVLHNISLQLQDVVKRDQDAPYCFDYKRYRQYEMFSLNEDICFEAEEYLNIYSDIISTERILKIVLLLISVLLIICFCVALWIGYRRFIRKPNYSFASTATYNRLPHPMNGF